MWRTLNVCTFFYNWIRMRSVATRANFMMLLIIILWLAVVYRHRRRCDPFSKTYFDNAKPIMWSRHYFMSSRVRLPKKNHHNALMCMNGTKRSCLMWAERRGGRTYSTCLCINEEIFYSKFIKFVLIDSLFNIVKPPTTQRVADGNGRNFIIYLLALDRHLRKCCFVT